MKYLKLFELFTTKSYYDITEDITKDGCDFYFNTERYDYKVSFTKYDHSYFFGFKAKPRNEPFYDFNIITNDNIIKILSTVKYILEKHYKKYKDKDICYIFSVQSSDKKAGHKRKRLYLKILEDMPEWNVDKDLDMDRWYLTRKNNNIYENINLKFLDDIKNLLKRKGYKADIEFKNDEMFLNKHKLTLDKYGNLIIELSDITSKIIGKINIDKNNYEKVSSAEEILEYVTNLHDNLDDDNLYERILKHKRYTLLNIKITDIISPYEIDDDKVEDYIKLYEKNKKYPPIVVDSTNLIIDGTHRYEALKKLGINEIKAYKPI